MARRAGARGQWNQMRIRNPAEGRLVGLGNPEKPFRTILIPLKHFLCLGEKHLLQAMKNLGVGVRPSS